LLHIYKYNADFYKGKVFLTKVFMLTVFILHLRYVQGLGEGNPKQALGKMATLNLRNVPHVTKSISQGEHYVVDKECPCWRASPEYRTHTQSRANPSPPARNSLPEGLQVGGICANHDEHTNWNTL
jgi:hypothetical protein